MKSQRFTPGPWNVINNTIPSGYRIKSTDTMIALCYHAQPTGCNKSMFNDPDAAGITEAKANAKLIAAAPDLYEACKDVLEGINELQGNGLSQNTRDIIIMAIQTDLAKALAKVDNT